MASAQSGHYPSHLSWADAVEMAAKTLNKRFNRSINTTPAEAMKHPAETMKKAWSLMDFVPISKMLADERALAEGHSIEEGHKSWKYGDLVLIPIPKQRRANVRDKDFMMHYELMPYEIFQIFHARRPYLFGVRSVHTKKKGKRLYYGSELKQISLPASIRASDIVDHRIVQKKGLQYKTSDNAWHTVR